MTTSQDILHRSQMRGLLTLASVMAFAALTSAAAQDAPPAVPAITTLSPPPAASTAPPSTPLVSTPPLSPPPLSGDASAAPPAPQGLSESVVVTVNDDLISTYDIVQRMRLRSEE